MEFNKGNTTSSSASNFIDFGVDEAEWDAIMANVPTSMLEPAVVMPPPGFAPIAGSSGVPRPSIALAPVAQTAMPAPDVSSEPKSAHHIRVSHTAGPSKRKVTDEAATPAKRVRKTKRSAALGVFTSEFLTPSEENEGDVKLSCNELRPQIHDLVVEEIREKRALKWRIVLKAQYTRLTINGEVETITSFHGSITQVEMMEYTIPDHIEKAIAKVEECVEAFLQLGSGWIFDKTLSVEVQMAKYAPLAGKSYIPLSKKIQAKKAVLNIQNDDAKCLLWCLLAHKKNFHRSVKPERVSHYIPHEADIKMEGVEYPVPVNKIGAIEKMNNLRINVFGCENDEIFPLYVSEREDSDVANLLLIASEERQHYCLIKNMSRLLGDLTDHDGKRFYCYRCLHRFSAESLLQDHLQYCKNVAPQRVRLPKQGENILKFDKDHYQHPVSYCIYADFESLIVPIESAQPPPSHSYTEKVAMHEACGYAYLIVGPDGRQTKPIAVYRGVDAATHFVTKLLEEREEIAEKLNDIIPMVLSPQEEMNFKTAAQCHICGGRLGSDRVRDHDHLTGRYRGAAHRACNLKYRVRKMIPVIFHNLKNYDAHHIVKTLGDFPGYEYSVIPTNMEKYISFTISCREEKRGEQVPLVFLDSLQFLSTSLEKLVGNLPPSDFHLLNENIQKNKVHLLLKKGVYPYEYMNSFQKFEEKSLPPKSAFFSSLMEEGISDEAYIHASTVWKEFNIKCMGDYHDLYVASDVYQLSDVFQKFRKICLTYYKIDPCHTFTAPGLGWQACLKMTDQPLELLTDIDMHLFVERGIRGGISTISKRHAKANNKYMPNFDPTSPSKYIMYLDANNLYGWAMSQPLPYGEFKWVDASQVDEAWIASIPSNSDVGYILEVDLEYGAELHDEHNLYPLAVEKMKIVEEMLSPSAKNILEELGNKFTSCEKLVPNLQDKTHYIVYHKNLQLYLSLGLKLKNVHKMMSFKQKAWLKPYIEFNTEKRKNAANSFEKDFFKLMNNSVYGKTMENLRNRVKIDLVNTERRALKVVADPSYRHYKIFSDALNKSLVYDDDKGAAQIKKLAAASSYRSQ
ncbi:uncharacterized protein LOC129228343 [Uloborus diversus]|uniref:uncharacterized protein LOC129228343 n=1 Tax=Uloborus diversus TaxID=327109 RepID=UPI00240A9C26|nr:uncharacterized protein LOC129228343 [Uloborus diversus]